MTPGDVDDNRFVRLIVTTVAAKSRAALAVASDGPARLGIILESDDNARAKKGGEAKLD